MTTSFPGLTTSTELTPGGRLAKTYLAKNQQGEELVLKTSGPNTSIDQVTFTTRMDQARRVDSDLVSHPVVTGHSPETGHWAAYEYIPGPLLPDVDLDDQGACEVLLDLAEGVKGMHEQGLTHGSISPRQVRVIDDEEDGVIPVLLDTGWPTSTISDQAQDVRDLAAIAQLVPAPLAVKTATQEASTLYQFAEAIELNRNTPDPEDGPAFPAPIPAPAPATGQDPAEPAQETTPEPPETDESEEDSEATEAVEASTHESSDEAETVDTEPETTPEPEPESTDNTPGETTPEETTPGHAPDQNQPTEDTTPSPDEENTTDEAEDTEADDHPDEAIPAIPSPFIVPANETTTDEDDDETEDDADEFADTTDPAPETQTPAQEEPATTDEAEDTSSEEEPEAPEEGAEVGNSVGAETEAGESDESVQDVDAPVEQEHAEPKGEEGDAAEDDQTQNSSALQALLNMKNETPAEPETEPEAEAETTQPESDGTSDESEDTEAESSGTVPRSSRGRKPRMPNLQARLSRPKKPAQQKEPVAAASTDEPAQGSKAHSGKAFFKKPAVMACCAVLAIGVIGFGGKAIFTGGDDAGAQADSKNVSQVSDQTKNVLDGYEGQSLWSKNIPDGAQVFSGADGTVILDGKTMTIYSTGSGKKIRTEELSEDPKFLVNTKIGDKDALVWQSKDTVYGWYKDLGEKGDLAQAHVSDQAKVSNTGQQIMIVDDGKVSTLGEKGAVSYKNETGLTPIAIDSSGLISGGFDVPVQITDMDGKQVSSKDLKPPKDDQRIQSWLSAGHGYAATIWSKDPESTDDSEKVTVAVHSLKDGSLTAHYDTTLGKTKDAKWIVGQGGQEAVYGNHVFSLSDGKEIAQIPDSAKINKVKGKTVEAKDGDTNLYFTKDKTGHKLSGSVLAETGSYLVMQKSNQLVVYPSSVA